MPAATFETTPSRRDDASPLRVRAARWWRTFPLRPGARQMAALQDAMRCAAIERGARWWRAILAEHGARMLYDLTPEQIVAICDAVDAERAAEAIATS